MVLRKRYQYCRVSLASPNQIRDWAERQLLNEEIAGCVTQRSTISYQTHKPHKDGLFCERIFGPVKSYVCACGKHHKSSDYEDRPTFCKDCGVEFTKSAVRRHRMGYIRMHCPVVHTWYLKQRPSYIACLLDCNPKDLDRLVSCSSYFVGSLANSPTLLARWEWGIATIEVAGWLERFVSPQWFSVLQHREISTGGEAVHRLLAGLNIEDELRDCRSTWQLLVDGEPRRQICKMIGGRAHPRSLSKRLRCGAAIRLSPLQRKLERGERARTMLTRLRMLESLLHAGIRPEWMVLSYLPVLPPVLRPMMELKRGQFVTSDLNTLYRAVMKANDELAEMDGDGVTPAFYVATFKAVLQQRVNQLLANGLGSKPRTDLNTDRPYKSLSDVIKGKGGRFRANLLGKRVDYSGRSVIIVGPDLPLNQCGLPKEMAIELFQPFLIRKLIANGLAFSPRGAKSVIRSRGPVVWKVLRDMLPSHVVVLNRAPTLHRLGMQAFHPVMVKERAICLHPLVCAGFNADFDGDQMAVHVPLSLQAQAEAHVVMSPILNLMSPATGEAIAVPSQDMLLGLYVLTLETGHAVHEHRPNAARRCLTQGIRPCAPGFTQLDGVLAAYNRGLVDFQTHIWLQWPSDGWAVSDTLREEPVEIQHEPSVGTAPLTVYEHCQIQSHSKGGKQTVCVRTTVGRALINQQIEQALGSRSLYPDQSSADELD